MDKTPKIGKLAATINLSESQVQQIIIEHIAKTGKINHLLSDDAAAYFNWHTSKWSDNDKLCTITYVNTAV